MPPVVELRCQLPEHVQVIGREPVRLTWRVRDAAPGSVQEAYEIEVATDADFGTIMATSGRVASHGQVGVVAPDTAMASRETRHYRVRIRSGGTWTDWSEALRVEAGLLDATDWSAVAVTLPDDPGADRQAPCPLVRHEFELSAVARRARLYVTSLGVHEIWINGQRVSADLLAPGWTTYHRRLLGETYDVTGLLTAGPNAIAGRLGDGWYRGRLGWDTGPRGRGHYGRELGLVAQLELELEDGSRRVVATDGSWMASTGSVRRADLYDGCDIDLRREPDGWTEPGFSAAGWVPVRVVPFDPAVVEPRIASPVRVVAELPVTRTERSGGAIGLDAGQNVAGWVRLRVRGTAGSVVIVRHAEVVEPDGALHTRALRSARAEDRYTLAADGEVELEPVMTFHGFRYAEVTTDAEVLDAVVVAVSSALEPRSTFECSLPALERFHANVVWSQLDNFVSVPTDCPQRDERLGWTGDAQAFAATGSTLFDVEAFWASWLRDLALDQDDVLGVSTLVPDAVIDGPARFGRAGWGDAATIVPWAVLESYGDPAVVLAQVDSMRRAITAYEGRLGADGLLPPSMQFGDWLDPDAPAERPWEAKADPTYIANAFLVHSARLAADAVAMAGDVAWADGARALADRVAAATWGRWGDHARTSQTGCAVALRFGIAPEDERGSLTAALARMVAGADGAVRTGFLGTPLVLPALSDAGRFAEAYRMLLRDEMPSWLYQVRQGATTVWERWDAILPDGSIHSGAMSTPPEMAERSQGEADNHMLSFNHYAYGAVIDWVYRHVAGIAPDPSAPGYRRVVFAPRPARGLEHARATIETAYGQVGIDWSLEGGGFSAEVSLPFGTSGTFRVPAPAGTEVTVDGSPRPTSGGVVELGPGHHVIRASEAEVVEPSEAPISG